MSIQAFYELKDEVREYFDATQCGKGWTGTKPGCKRVKKGEGGGATTKNKGIVPDRVPSNVVLAIQAQLHDEFTKKELSKLSPETQKYTEAWGLVKHTPIQDHHLEIINKAKEVAKQNRWDWDGIVKKVQKEDGFVSNSSGFEALRNMDKLRTANAKKQQAFSKNADKEARERQRLAQKEADQKAKQEKQALAKQIRERQSQEKKAKAVIARQIESVLKKLPPDALTTPKTRKGKSEQMNQLAYITGTPNEVLLNEVLEKHKAKRGIL